MRTSTPGTAATKRRSCTPRARAAQAARLLLDHGADLNATTSWGSDALMDAYEHPAMVRVLLEAGANPNRVDSRGGGVLFTAVEENLPKVVRLLVESGADLNVQGPDGKTALRIATEEGNTPMFNLLSRLGARDSGGAQGREMAEEELRQAARAGDLKRVRELLRQGVDVNAPKKHVGTPLWFAADEGHAKVVQELLAAGADVNARGEYLARPLHKAAEGGHLQIVRMLLKHGAKVDVTYGRAIEGYEGWTPLMAAAEGGHLEMVEALLAAGADVDAQTKSRMTALQFAAANNQTAVVRRLKEAGTRADASADPSLEATEFPERLRQSAYKRAVADLAKTCGGKPQRLKEFPNGVLFTPKRTSVATERLERLVRHFADELLKQEAYEEEDEALQAARSLGDGYARELVIHDVIDRVQDEYLRRGCYVVLVPQFHGDRLALLPTTNPLAVVACLGPAPRELPR